MSRNFECLASGDACSSCLEVANSACRDILEENGVPKDTARSATERSGHGAIIDNTNGVSALECEDRRQRAKIIGEDAARRILNRP